MEFEEIYNKSIVIAPSEDMGVFIATELDANARLHYYLGRRLLLSLIAPEHLEQFKAGDLRHLPDYVSEDQENAGMIVPHTRGHLTTLPGSVMPRVYFGGAGKHIWEVQFPPNR
ncbi:MAG: hypothetical protein JWO96_786 [Candidatus Saccharibacteria bacterium]|nr:hypothetical protein [Candidatus Saccharibacteria bacterium]